MNNEAVQCDDVEVAIWGSLYPLYSPTSRRIYKNTACMECNGVNDGIAWTPTVNCNHVVHIDEVFVANEIGPKCFLVFEFDSKSVNAYLPQCDRVELQTTCLKPYEQITRAIPQETGMSVSDVIDACKSGFYSPIRTYFGPSFENPFCFLCHIHSLERLKERYVNDSSDSRSGEAVSFSFIMIPKARPLLADHQTVHYMACPKQTTEQELQKQVCINAR